MCSQFRGVAHWHACCVITTSKRLAQKALVLWWGLREKEEGCEEERQMLNTCGLESTTGRCSSNQWSLKSHLDAGEYIRKKASDTVIWWLSVTMEMAEQTASESLSQFERVSVLRPRCASPCERNQEWERRMTILTRTWRIRTKAKDNFSFINIL